MGEVFKVGDLTKLIRETSNEFKAVLGKNVDKLNKQNNEKAYNDIEKSLKKYDGGLRQNKDNGQVIAANDDNKGMQDLIYDESTINKDFKEKVKSQMKGYTSNDDEKNHKQEELGNAYRREDLSDVEGKFNKNKDLKRKSKESGLTGRELKDTLKNDNKEGVFENNNRKMKQLYFKKTEFTDESHITSKIPEEFRVESTRFIVKDKTDTEYLVEWSCNKANVIEKTNKTMLNEQLNRMKELMAYNPNKQFEVGHSSRVNEDEIFRSKLDNVRILIDENKKNN